MESLTIVAVILLFFSGVTLVVFHSVRIGLRPLLGNQKAAHFSLLATILAVFGVVGFVVLSPQHPDSDLTLYIILFIAIAAPSTLWWRIQVRKFGKKAERNSQDQ